MKSQFIYLVTLIISVVVFTGCGNNSAEPNNEEQTEHEEHAESEMATVHLSQLKFESLGVKIDTLPTRVLSGLVEANGQLEVPPQHEATVTAILGANITSIKVIEGDKVRKGQVLAYLSHPNLTQLQTNYVKAYRR